MVRRNRALTTILLFLASAVVLMAAAPWIAWFRARDRNRSGKLSTKEAGLPPKTFKAADRNRDGYLSLAEVKQSRVYKTASTGIMRTRNSRPRSQASAVRVGRPASTGRPSGQIRRPAGPTGGHRAAMLGKRYLWVGGEAGLLLHSTNVGKTWQRRNLPLKAPVTALASDGGSRLVAGLRRAGKIAYSHDGGLNWRLGAVDGNVWIDDIIFIPSPRTLKSGRRPSVGGIFLGVGHGKHPRYVVTSCDYGKTWQRTQTPTGSMSGLAFDGRNTIVAVGGGSMRPGTSHAAPVMYSTDRGRTWQETLKGTAGSATLRDVTYDRRFNRFIAVGGSTMKGATVRYSNDGGKSWKAATIGGHALFCVAASGHGIVLASGRGGGVHISRDGGVTWPASGSPSNAIQRFQSIEYNGLNFVLAGHEEGKRRVNGRYQRYKKGCVYITRYGKQWRRSGSLGGRTYCTAVMIGRK